MPTAKTRRLSRQHKPADMALEDWQIELRRQFGREQPLRLKNIGADPVFSDYQVTNPQRGSTYRVAIRGTAPGDNYCSCPDFSANALGTCKHVEFVLGRLEHRRRTDAVSPDSCCSRSAKKVSALLTQLPWSNHLTAHGPLQACGRARVLRDGWFDIIRTFRAGSSDIRHGSARTAQSGVTIGVRARLPHVLRPGDEPP